MENYRKQLGFLPIKSTLSNMAHSRLLSSLTSTDGNTAILLGGVASAINYLITPFFKQVFVERTNESYRYDNSSLLAKPGVEWYIKALTTTVTVSITYLLVTRFTAHRTNFLVGLASTLFLELILNGI